MSGELFVPASGDGPRRTPARARKELLPFPLSATEQHRYASFRGKRNETSVVHRDEGFVVPPSDARIMAFRAEQSRLRQAIENVERQIAPLEVRLREATIRLEEADVVHLDDQGEYHLGLAAIEDDVRRLMIKHGLQQKLYHGRLPDRAAARDQLIQEVLRSKELLLSEDSQVRATTMHLLDAYGEAREHVRRAQREASLIEAQLAPFLQERHALTAAMEDSVNAEHAYIRKLHQDEKQRHQEEVLQAQYQDVIRELTPKTADLILDALDDERRRQTHAPAAAHEALERFLRRYKRDAGILDALADHSGTRFSKGELEFLVENLLEQAEEHGQA